MTLAAVGGAFGFTELMRLLAYKDWQIFQHSAALQ